MSEQAVPSGIPAVTLGWRLRMAIEHAGIKVSDLADEIGVTRGTLSRWGHDDGAPPRDGFLRIIAIRCGVPYEWIKYGSGASDTGPDQGDPMRTCTDDNVYELARRTGATARRRAA